MNTDFGELRVTKMNSEPSIPQTELPARSINWSRPWLVERGTSCFYLCNNGWHFFKTCGDSNEDFANAQVVKEILGSLEVPSVEPAGPKSSPVSEFSQTPTSLETGGRNALHLQQLADFLEELPAKIDDAQQNECLCGSIQAEFGCPQCSAMSALYREIEEVAHSASQMSDNCDDTARLDWLELNGFQRVDEDTCRQSMHVGLLGITFDKGRNLRDAIDAAIVLQDARAASDGKEQGEH